MKKYSKGLFIGRFQPFHLGHLSAIKQGLKLVETLTLVIGSANRNFDLTNPLTYQEREQLVNVVLEREQLREHIERITSLDDDANNLAWVETLIAKNPEFEVVVGNNALVTVLTNYKNYKQFHPDLTKREKWQGMIIRENVVKKREWKTLVPEYTLPLLEEFGFEERLLALNEKG